MVRKVFIGLSGGVDSSLAASLLLEAGESVVGAFVKIDVPEVSECTWREDRIAAKRTAATLGIPFVEYDLSEIHNSQVVENMVRAYREGRTPNPDALCNRVVKFGALWDAVRADGATHLATGHYARNEEKCGMYLLKKGVDETKDQSYFLWQLTHHDLEHALFPLGNLHKRDVRRMAEARRLPSAERPDSQGLCFVGNVSLSDFLDLFDPQITGDVLDKNGTIIGTHQGASKYTIGQRHGFLVATPTEEPWYVIARDTTFNTITVSHTSADAYVQDIILNHASWVNDAPNVSDQITVALRYHGEEHSVAYHEGNKFVLEKPTLATSGQSAVVYRGDICLGGGEIA